MNPHRLRLAPLIVTLSLALLVITTPVSAGEYAALAGVKGLNTVFDFTQGTPAFAKVVMGAIQGVHADPSVRGLAAPPNTVIVFHGKATRLISTDRRGIEPADAAALDAFAEMIRQNKQNGIRMEVCMYAVKVLGIDPATLMPEIERVGNGFISVAGYQAQGYAVVTVP